MENATTALYIAAGTLIGVMIISLVVFFFRRVGTMYSEQDAIMSTEQLAEWNKEYLAYDKKLMYGTDLVSVLNKATNNNLKYVNGAGFLSGFTYTNAYLIDIEFTINSVLQDNITVSFIDSTGESGRIIGREYLYPVDSHNGPEGTPKLYEIFNHYKIVNSYNSINTNINNNTALESKVYDSIFGNGNTQKTYNLLKSDHTIDETVAKLMDLSSNLTMTVTNKDKSNINLEPIFTNGVWVKNKYGWYKAIWKTCLADLKSRKFQCTGVEYDTSSEETGRITKMIFKEL